jgi:ribonuclease HII
LQSATKPKYLLNWTINTRESGYFSWYNEAMLTVGIDEVGRGCWAGPVVAAAVLFGEVMPPGLTDSKLLSRKRREFLSQEIIKHAIGVGIGWVHAPTVDKLGLTEAVRRAMTTALGAISSDYDDVIIDGNHNFLSDVAKTSALINADQIVPAVSAASIVAKVARDNYMATMAEQFPEYGFDQHVGYGTALHLDNLHKFGVSELHRRSYKPIKSVLALRQQDL